MVGMSWTDGISDSQKEGGYLVGGSIPGLPLFTYGRSKSYAWGATAINPDNLDLFVEKVDGDKYLFDGVWYEFKVVREVFKVRFGADIIYDIKFTHNGPLLYKPSKDDLGFSIWFPLEFLN